MSDGVGSLDSRQKADTDNQNKNAHFTVCVFCGSGSDVSKTYALAAREVAEAMATNHWRLVYGGGTRGLMGSLARTLVGLSGPSAVHGIIPAALLRTERGIVAPDEAQYGQTTLVSTMHERKTAMASEADAFLALPGGFGTMEELFEVISWNQLGIHSRPIIVFNVDGFFDDLLAWTRKASIEGLIPVDHLNIFSVAETTEEVITKIRLYRTATTRYMLDWAPCPVDGRRHE